MISLQFTPCAGTTMSHPVMGIYFSSFSGLNSRLITSINQAYCWCGQFDGNRTNARGTLVVFMSTLGAGGKIIISVAWHSSFRADVKVVNPVSRIRCVTSLCQPALTNILVAVMRRFRRQTTAIRSL
jgi:hypothetical protein